MFDPTISFRKSKENIPTSNCWHTLSISTVHTPLHFILQTLLRFQRACILSNMLCVRPSLPEEEQQNGHSQQLEKAFTTSKLPRHTSTSLIIDFHHQNLYIMIDLHQDSPSKEIRIHNTSCIDIYLESSQNCTMPDHSHIMQIIQDAVLLLIWTAPKAKTNSHLPHLQIKLDH